MTRHFALFCLSAITVGCNRIDIQEARLEDSARASCGVSAAGEEVRPPPGTGPVTFSLKPELTGTTDSDVPLVGWVSAITDTEAVMQLHVAGGGEQWDVGCSAPDTYHRKAVVGLKPDTQYTVTAQFGTQSGWTQTEPLVWQTPTLPESFPPLNVVVSRPAQMEPGWTLFNVRTVAGVYVIVVDEAGDVRWFYTSSKHPASYDQRVDETGNLLFGSDQWKLLRMNWGGQLLSSWHALNYPDKGSIPAGSVGVKVNAFHHDQTPMPNGNYAVLSSEARYVDDFATDTVDPKAPRARSYVVADVIAEFTPKGKVVKYISMFDVLDTERIGHGSLGTWWSRAYGDKSRDWTHGNALFYDEEDDAFLISLRNQDAILKINRSTEELVWILGNHANWPKRFRKKLLEPIGDLQWNFHQHAVKRTSAGIGMYDNGTYGVPAYVEPPGQTRSRAVEFAVDEEKMTVEQIWSYGPPRGQPGWFSSRILSDADWLPTSGNVLVTHGALRTNTDPNSDFARIEEVTTDGEVVFRIDARGSSGDPAERYTAYRASRIDDLRR